MKVKNEYIQREIAGEYLLIPVGEAAMKTKGLISMSESGNLLYQRLQEGCTREDLVEALLQEYEVLQDEASRDVDAFLDQMRQIGMLEE